MEFNIADLLECVADAVPEREAVVCRDDRRTYAELDERATRLAHALRAAGVGVGDHVGLYLRNSVAHLEVMLACYKARAVPINVNYRYVTDELQYLCDDADLVALFHDDDTVEHVAAARSPAARADRRSPVRAEYDALVASGASDARPRPPLPRRPLRPLHRRHDRPAQGRGVAPGGHVLRRARQREPRRPADQRARSRSAASVLDNPAQRLRPFLPPGDDRDAVRLARARAVDARERAVVGARHAARRRQGRALRRAARRHGARARPARTRARERVQPRRRRERAPDARTRSPRSPAGGTCRRCGCSGRAAASCRAT